MFGQRTLFQPFFRRLVSRFRKILNLINGFSERRRQFGLKKKNNQQCNDGLTLLLLSLINPVIGCD